jgi:outer membrane biosynthesis protein TonB
MQKAAWRKRYLIPFLLSFVASAQTTIMLMSPAVVRQTALQAPLPRYPLSSIQSHHHGVAVAQVDISSEDGVTKSVKVLQSPDKAINDSVAAALRLWKFKWDYGAQKGRLIRTRFIFYFDLDESGPHVKDATRSSF